MRAGLTLHTKWSEEHRQALGDGGVRVLRGHDCAKPMIFAYFGPETSLPLTSAATAVVGFALMMGRVSFAFITRRIRFARRK